MAEEITPAKSPIAKKPSARKRAYSLKGADIITAADEPVTAVPIIPLSINSYK